MAKYVELYMETDEGHVGDIGRVMARLVAGDPDGSEHEDVWRLEIPADIGRQIWDESDAVERQAWNERDAVIR